MIFKAGCKQDKWNYRPVCLMTHAYKVLSHIILITMQDILMCSIPDSQCGFTRGRSGDENTVQLQWLAERVHKEGRKVIVGFIDFKDAFSSISHSFMMKCLKDAGVSKEGKSSNI